MTEPLLQASIIIPVWNGAEVIADCLRALAAHSGPALAEILCVDNASADDSASLISRDFPHVRLLRQPANLGFAGGVNRGLEAAQGDLLVLLNQDCLVLPGWLDDLRAGLQAQPTFGIAGCTVLDAGGAVNHVGAELAWPEAVGRHLTALPVPDGGAQAVPYVTGAVFALRRDTWNTLGPLDEDFYPAYYEETDYCFRARRHGIGVGVIPQAQVRHLVTSRDWQRDPVRYWANQQQARYRFVAKHAQSAAPAPDQAEAPFSFATFVRAELDAIAAEAAWVQAVARALAARHTLHTLEATLSRRAHDLAEELTPAARRHFAAGFIQLLQSALARARVLMAAAFPPSPWERGLARLWPAVDALTGSNLAARAAHRAQLGARIKLLELLSDYEYR